MSIAIPEPDSLTLPASHPTMTVVTEFERAYLLLRERILMTELNWVRRMLGKQAERCPHCGGMIK